MQITCLSSLGPGQKERASWRGLDLIIPTGTDREKTFRSKISQIYYPLSAISSSRKCGATSVLLSGALTPWARVMILICMPRARSARTSKPMSTTCSCTYLVGVTYTSITMFDQRISMYRGHGHVQSYCVPSGHLDESSDLVVQATVVPSS